MGEQEERPIGYGYRRITDHSLERLEALDAVERFVRQSKAIKSKSVLQTGGGVEATPPAEYTDLTMLAEWLLHDAEHYKDLDDPR